MIFLLCAISAPAQGQQQPPDDTVTEMDDLPRSSDEDNKKTSFTKGRTFQGRSGRTFTGLLSFEISRVAAEKIRLTREEKAEYKNYSRSNLKILKLFTAPPCAGHKLVVNIGADECLRAGDLVRVSYYSFLLEMYGERISDFRLLDDQIIAGDGRYTHGILIDLGPVDVEKISRTSPEVELLFNYPVARTLDDETAQRQELEKGIAYRDLLLASRQKLTPGNVYLMRLTPYSFKTDRRGYFTQDSVFVLKIAKLDEDKITTIVWKKLAARGAPRLN